jgi:hypothetical protein
MQQAHNSSIDTTSIDQEDSKSNKGSLKTATIHTDTFRSHATSFLQG